MLEVFDNLSYQIGATILTIGLLIAVTWLREFIIELAKDGYKQIKKQFEKKPKIHFWVKEPFIDIACGIKEKDTGIDIVVSIECKDNYVEKSLCKKCLLVHAKGQLEANLIEEKQQHDLFEKRRNELIKLYGETETRRILDGKYWIGMSDDMCYKSLGPPDRKNTNRVSGGADIQWAYYSRNLYLYFEKNICISYQKLDE